MRRQALCGMKSDLCFTFRHKKQFQYSRDQADRKRQVRQRHQNILRQSDLVDFSGSRLIRCDRGRRRIRRRYELAVIWLRIWSRIRTNIGLGKSTRLLLGRRRIRQGVGLGTRVRQRLCVCRIDRSLYLLRKFRIERICIVLCRHL